MSGAVDPSRRKAHEAVNIAIRQCMNDTGLMPAVVIVATDVWDALKDPISGGVTYPCGVTVHIIEALAPGSVCAMKTDPWACAPAYTMRTVVP